MNSIMNKYTLCTRYVTTRYGMCALRIPQQKYNEYMHQHIMDTLDMLH